jgi:crotonobetainyl-CoA:carnitine CoA-transferase CaiB-like acyl-CoA transferase
MEIKRRLKKVEANFISLVGKGANNKIIIYKSANDSLGEKLQKQIEIKKIDEDQHMVYGIVYSPDEIDLQGDLASADVIKDMAYNFMKNAKTNNVDQQHNFVSDEGFVAESWLTKKADPVFPFEKEGSWAVGIKVEKDDTWQLVKNGEITGLSLAGLAVVEEIAKSDGKIQTGASLTEKLKKYFSFKKQINLLTDLEKLKASFNEIQNMINQTESNQSAEANVYADVTKKITAGSKNINGENEMKPEMLKKAVDEELKPINEKLEQLEKANQDLASRIEAIERSTPGSRQVVKKDRSCDNQIPIWT